MNDLSTFLATIAPYALTGAIVSGIVQATKSYLAKSNHKFLYVVGASVVLGVGAHFVGAIPANWLVAIGGVWASANTIYVTFNQIFGDSTPPPSLQPSSAPSTASVAPTGQPS